MDKNPNRKFDTMVLLCTFMQAHFLLCSGFVQLALFDLAIYIRSSNTVQWPWVTWSQLVCCWLLLGQQKKPFVLEWTTALRFLFSSLNKCQLQRTVSDSYCTREITAKQPSVVLIGSNVNKVFFNLPIWFYSILGKGCIKLMYSKDFVPQFSLDIFTDP